MTVDGALRAFGPLPLRERLFVRARLFSAPLEELARRTPAGRVADIGCGHGVLSALLADGTREVVGVDPDPRKIDWARAAKIPNARFETGTVEQLAAREPGSFDAVVVADVLYLLPVDAWPGFLRACARCLKPGGALLLKEAEADGSWRYQKCVLQERVMVRVLRRTKSSGGLGFQPRDVTERIIRDSGFNLRDTVSLARGYSTPHVLFIGEVSSHGEGRAA